MSDIVSVSLNITGVIGVSGTSFVSTEICFAGGDENFSNKEILLNESRTSSISDSEEDLEELEGDSVICNCFVVSSKSIFTDVELEGLRRDANG